MRLFYSPSSPFVRKVLVVAHEAGLRDRIELGKSAAGPLERDPEIVSLNPLGQVPTLITGDGTMLADSRVICEYLDNLARANIFPAPSAARWTALAEQSAADGLLDAALLCRYERLIRPNNAQWDDWYGGQFAKIISTLDFLAERACGLSNRTDIGTIAAACALSYLDHRFSDLDWRSGRTRLADWFFDFSQRPSMLDTILGVKNSRICNVKQNISTPASEPCPHHFRTSRLAERTYLEGKGCRRRGQPLGAQPAQRRAHRRVACVLEHAGLDNRARGAIVPRGVRRPRDRRSCPDTEVESASSLKRGTSFRE